MSRDSVVAKVEAGMPADVEVGLKPGDRLLSLQITREGGGKFEKPIGTWWMDLASLGGLDATSRFTVTFQRGRQVMAKGFSLVARERVDPMKNTHTEYVFGAENERVVDTYVFERDVGVVHAMVEAGKRVAADMTLITKGMAMMAQRKIPSDQLGGPILLFVIAEQTANRGWEEFLFIMAMISVNLGLFNLLPVPVLDGGHLMFLGLELVQRRPPSIRVRELANAAGLAILLMLMVLAFKNDLMRHVFG